jgi:hypothetical protein
MRKKVKWFIVGGVLCLVAAVVFKLAIEQLEMVGRRRSLQTVFAAEAGHARRMLAETEGLTEDAIGRTKKAAQLLANGVFDDSVLLFWAQVRPPARQKHQHPLFRNSPSLAWFMVDEQQNVAFVHYSKSNDPNDFGKPLFSIRRYCLLSPYAQEEILPKHVWLIPLKCFGRTEDYSHRRLWKYDDGVAEPYISLEVSVSEWNALVSGRGQLILRDRMNRELDRMRLIPLVEAQEQGIMESLKLPLRDNSSGSDSIEGHNGK